jgi:hypothetical protein
VHLLVAGVPAALPVLVAVLLRVLVAALWPVPKSVSQPVAPAAQAVACDLVHARRPAEAVIAQPRECAGWPAPSGMPRKRPHPAGTSAKLEFG